MPQKSLCVSYCMSTVRNVVARWLLANTESTWVRSGDRRDYLDAVWAMYRESYAKIGTHISSPSGLLEYDTWEISLDEGQPITFHLYKTTQFGLKTGLLGSDGSAKAKSIIKAHLRTRYSRGNIYGEVSHAVERLTQGAPVVCAVYVAKVLGKPVAPSADGVHYERKLEGLGMVTKKMIGNPRGVPTGSEEACPIPENPGEMVVTRVAERTRIAAEMDAAEHACCQLFEDDE